MLCTNAEQEEWKKTNKQFDNDDEKEAEEEEV